MSLFCTEWKNVFEQELDTFRIDNLYDLNLESPELLAINMSTVIWKLPTDCFLSTPLSLSRSGETLENGMWLQNRSSVTSGFLINFDIEVNGVRVPICPSLFGDEQHTNVAGSFGQFEVINARDVLANGEPFLPTVVFSNSRLYGLYKQIDDDQINRVLANHSDGRVVLDYFLELLSKSLGKTLILKGIDAFIDDSVSVIPTINECWKQMADVISESFS